MMRERKVTGFPGLRKREVSEREEFKERGVEAVRKGDGLLLQSARGCKAQRLMWGDVDGDAEPIVIWR